MEYTADKIEKAVTLFYRSETQQQAEAHLWLNAAQNSVQAWSFVWELLSPQRNSEVQFFAATTLHTKLLKYWNEVPQDHYEILKKRILEAIINYAMGPKIVLNRLCIALSAYIIQTIPIHWPKAFEELVSSFQPQHLPTVEPERVIWILLEILTVIPEEFQSTTLSVSQRSRVRIVLQEVSQDILKVVEMCLMPLPETGFNIANLTTYMNAARCSAAWIQLGGLGIDECSNVSNLLIDLTCHIYWSRFDVKVDTDYLSPEEIELMEVNIESLTNIIQHPNASKYKSYVLKFTSNMLYKFDKILDVETRKSDPNNDIVVTLYGLIITVADSHSKIFVTNLQESKLEEQKISYDLFNSILKCSNAPGLYPVDESSSTLTFGFWYTLQDDVLGLKATECTKLLPLIKPYYRDLVCVMLRKAMFPIAESSDWSDDNQEMFRCYRQDIADTFMYCYNVLNLEMLDILHTKLNGALRRDSGDEMPIMWNEVETCLHAYGSVAECIEMENLYLPKLMMTIKTIPFSELHVKVMATALETIGAYSEWITEHPEILENVFPLVISALCNAEVATSATMALKDITHLCQKHIRPYADLILVTTQSVLQNNILKLAECRRLMFSIGKVLSVLPVSRVMDYLNVILPPTFEELQKLVNSESSPSTSTSISTKLKMLASLYSSLCITATPPEIAQQPILVVMQNSFQIYRIIGEKYHDNLDVTEDLGTLLKCTLTNLMDDSKPLVNDVLQVIVSIYKNTPQANILVVAKTVVIMFGKDPEFKDLNQQLLQEIVNTTLQMCSQYNSNNQQLSEKSDVLEGFFAMLSQIVKKVPELVFNPGIDGAALFQCATICLILPETSTLKACSSFLVNFITQSRDIAQANIIQMYGEELVLRILLNLGSTASRSCVDIFSDILLALNKKYCDNLSRWMYFLLAQENFPSNKITSRQKENFVKLVLREKANKRKLTEIILEFTLICRGILREDNNLA